MDSESGLPVWLTVASICVASAAWPCQAESAENGTGRLRSSLDVSRDYDWVGLLETEDRARGTRTASSYLNNRIERVGLTRMKSGAPDSGFAPGERIVLTITLSNSGDEPVMDFKSGAVVSFFVRCVGEPKGYPDSVRTGGFVIPPSGKHRLQYDVTATHSWQKTRVDQKGEGGVCEITVDLIPEAAPGNVIRQTAKVKLLPQKDTGVTKTATCVGKYGDTHTVQVDDSGRIIRYELQPSTNVWVRRHHRGAMFPWAYSWSSLRERYGSEVVGSDTLEAHSVLAVLRAVQQRVGWEDAGRLLRDRLIWRQIPLRTAVRLAAPVHDIKLSTDPRDRPILQVRTEDGVSVIRLASCPASEMEWLDAAVGLNTTGDRAMLPYDTRLSAFSEMVLERIDLSSTREKAQRLSLSVAHKIFACWENPSEKGEQEARRAMDGYLQAVSGR